MNTLLLVAALSVGDVKIAEADRVTNIQVKQPAAIGNCYYAAAETLARHHGLERLHGFAAGKGQCKHQEMVSALRARGVGFRWSPNKELDIIEKACNDGLGCVVCSPQHALVIVDTHIIRTDLGNGGSLLSGSVTVIDNCNPHRTREHWSVSRFVTWWDGTSLIIYPDEKNGQQVRASK